MRTKTSTSVWATLSIALVIFVTLPLAACDLSGQSPGAVGTPASTGRPMATAQPTTTGGPSVATRPTTGTSQPASTLVPMPQPTGDGRITPEDMFHDSRDPEYRDPVGAVPGGALVTLRLKTAPGDLAGASVRLWNSTTEAETLVPMSPVDEEMWEASIETPSEGAALWYRFIGTDGSANAYYNDDRDRDGGKGEGNLYASDTDYVLTAYAPSFKTPDWVKDAVVYQIFPDRFYNGDPQNDKPAGSFIYGGKTVRKEWGGDPTGGDDFFGGDLRGVIAKLDYIQSLGVTAIWFNPVFAAPSNHRYDTTDFTQIEPSLGDLATFKELVAEAKKRDIRIILDGVFNHSSSDSVYFDKFSRYGNEGAYEAQGSPYFGWYTFREWPKKYNSWSGIDTLPVFSESDEVKSFLFTGEDSVVKQWMREGLGGWRLDAAEQKSHAFWRELRATIKAQDPEAIIVGEFWQNSAPWLAGDQWDGAMNYRFRDAVLGWLANEARSPQMLTEQLDSIREDYPPQALAASMNLVGSHDTRRALTEAGGDKNMLRLMALMQFTWPGIPTIYYGDEAGMEGGRDPDDRRTYPWGAEDTSLVEFYRTLSRIRHANTALQTGQYINLGYNNELDLYAYARKDTGGVAVIALNRSNEDQEFALPMGGVAPNGTKMVDELNAGREYMVSGGTLKVKVPARWGTLILAK